MLCFSPVPLASGRESLSPWPGPGDRQELLERDVEIIRSFIEKRPPDYEGLRQAYAQGAHPEYFWGAPFVTCPHCGARNLPEAFKFCGNCGQALPANSD